MNKAEKEWRRKQAAKVAKARNARIRRGRCRQCGVRTAKNRNTGKRYRMCPKHRAVDCARKKAR